MHYYYVTTLDNTITYEREATAEEYDSLSPHIAKVSRMLMDKRRIDIVTNAHKKVMLEFGRLENGEKTPYQSDELVFSLTYYLAAFKKYLDNWETHLKRTYGKSSEEFKLFKLAQNKEYDNHMEYRIFYRLRNYDQHCGNLVSKIIAKVLPDGSSQYLVLADRNRLLHDFDEWKPEEITYLSSCEDYFDIRPLIQVFHRCIDRIHDEIMQIHFSTDFYISCATIIAVAKEFDNEDNVQIIRNEDEINWADLDIAGKSLNLTYLQVPICKKILEIHFINNRKWIKVLYHGVSLKKSFANFGYEIDFQKASEISHAPLPVVNFCGQKMIRLYGSAFLDKCEVYCILADSHFPREEQKNICETWTFLLNSIIKV